MRGTFPGTLILLDLIILNMQHLGKSAHYESVHYAVSSNPYHFIALLTKIRGKH
jgi:hypothetical protein